MTRKVFSSDVHLNILLLTVFIDTFCSSLVLPEHSPSSHPRPPLIITTTVQHGQQEQQRPPLDYRTPGSVDLYDKQQGPAVRSDLSDDRNQIPFGGQSPSGDSGIIISSGRVEPVATEDVVVVESDNGQGGSGSEAGASGQDNTQQADPVKSKTDNNTVNVDASKQTTTPRTINSTNPVRWWTTRATTNTPATTVNFYETPDKEGVARSDNNGQINSSGSNEDDNTAITEELLLPTEANSGGRGEDGDGEDQQPTTAEMDETTNNDGGGGGSAAAAGNSDCILGSSDVYLAWWINIDGSLKKIEQDDTESSGKMDRLLACCGPV